MGLLSGLKKITNLITGKTGAQASEAAGRLQGAAAAEGARITADAATSIAERNSAAFGAAGDIGVDAYGRASQIQQQAIAQAAEIERGAALEATGMMTAAQRQALDLVRQQYDQGQQEYSQLISQLAPAQQIELQGLQRQEKGFGAQAVLAGNAQQQLGDLMGLNGSPQQMDAQNAVLDNPAQVALRERAANLSTRTAAAIGGLGGGNIRKELFDQSKVMDAQALQQQTQNLAALIDRGTQSVGQGATGMQANAIANRVATGDNAAALTGEYIQGIGNTQAQGAATVGGITAGGVTGQAGVNAQGIVNVGSTRMNALTGAADALSQGQMLAAQARAGGVTGQAQGAAAGLLGAAQARAQGLGNVIKIGSAIAGGK